MALNVTNKNGLNRTVQVNPASMATNTEQTIAVTDPNALPSYIYVAQMPALEAGIIIRNVTCTTRGTINVILRNVTAGTIDPALQELKIVAV